MSSEKNNNDDDDVWKKEENSLARMISLKTLAQEVNKVPFH